MIDFCVGKDYILLQFVLLPIIVSLP